MAKSKSAKKVVKKGSRKSMKKRSEQKVFVCPACYSHDIIESPAGFACQRCDHVSAAPLVRSLSEAKELLRARKRHLAERHKAIRRHHDRKMVPFLERFHLRMWFKIISTIILAGGIVLLFSEESATGVVFTIVGIVGLWHAVTSL